jgi:hypothetical protein
VNGSGSNVVPKGAMGILVPSWGGSGRNLVKGETERELLKRSYCEVGVMKITGSSFPLYEWVSLNGFPGGGPGLAEGRPVA